MIQRVKGAAPVEVPRFMEDVTTQGEFRQENGYLRLKHPAPWTAIESLVLDIARRHHEPLKVEYGVPSGSEGTIWLMPDGTIHCPFGHPAQETRQGNSFKLRWTNTAGELHRDGGPAEIEHLGWSRFEKWYRHGMLHRPDCYAESIVHQEPDSRCRYGDLSEKDRGKSNLFQDYEVVSRYKARHRLSYLHGVTTALGGRPAVVDEIDGGFDSFSLREDGTLIRKVYWARIQWAWFAPVGPSTSTGTAVLLHRTNGPARIEMFDVQEVWENDRLVTRRHDTWSCAWWVNGREVGHTELQRWLDIHGISLVEPYPIERSAWRNEVDEFAFLSDFSR